MDKVNKSGCQKYAFLQHHTTNYWFLIWHKPQQRSRSRVATGNSASRFSLVSEKWRRRSFHMRQNGVRRGKIRRGRGGEWLLLRPRCSRVGGTRSGLHEKKVNWMSLKRAFVKNSIFLSKIQYFFMLASWAFSAALHRLEWEWSPSFRLEDTPGAR